MNLMNKLGEARGQLTRIRFVSAPYLKFELTEEIDTIIQQTTNLNLSEISKIEDRLVICMGDISVHAKKTYLF